MWWSRGLSPVTSSSHRLKMDQSEGKDLGKSSRVMLQKKKEGRGKKTQNQTTNCKMGDEGNHPQKWQTISLSSFLGGKGIDWGCTNAGCVWNTWIPEPHMRIEMWGTGVVAFYRSKTFLTFLTLLLEARATMLCLQRNSSRTFVSSQWLFPSFTQTPGRQSTPPLVTPHWAICSCATCPLLGFGTLHEMRVSLLTHEHCLPFLGCFTGALPDRHLLVRLLRLHYVCCSIV